MEGKQNLQHQATRSTQFETFRFENQSTINSLMKRINYTFMLFRYIFSLIKFAEGWESLWSLDIGPVGLMNCQNT